MWVFVWLFFTTNAFSFTLFDLDSFNLSFSKFGCNRDAMTPQYDCKDYVGRVGMDFNLRLLEYGYWENTVHTEGTEAQVKTVGWRWNMGLKLTPYLDLFYKHHSRHVMEGMQPRFVDHDDVFKQSKFPVEDSYGVRIRFYINPNQQRSVFDD